MKKIILIVALLIYFFYGSIVSATSGRLSSSTIKTCNGVTYGKHSNHWHVAKKSGKYYYASGSAMYSDPCKKSSSSSSKSTYTKSSVKTLSSITVDDEEINISENMSIKTNNHSPVIVATATSDKATVKINQSKELSYGNNKITITVTAENKSTKKYYLNIYLINDDNTLKNIKVDENNIEISDNMEYKTTNINPDIKAIPSSSTSKVEIEKENDLIVGNNKIKVIVTAENDTKKEYELNLYIISTDATLKILKIDNDNVNIEDNMNYTTTSSSINISAIANNENATVVYEEKKKLEIGVNEIKINVLAEDGKTEKNYTINVTREKILSDNTNVKIFLNGEEVKFNKYKSEIVYIDNSIEEINIKYELEDKKSRIELDYNKKIEVGDKVIKFKVISESGKEQEYEINIHRYSKTEDIISGIICIGILASIGFGCYKFLKKGSR